MSPDELAFLSAVELAAMIRTRKVSPVEVTKSLLARIERLNPALNAFVTMHAEEALCSGTKAEEALMSGQRVGPLHKDNLAVAGSRTTFGSKLTEAYVTADDCPAVERLRQAQGARTFSGIGRGRTLIFSPPNQRRSASQIFRSRQ